MRPLAEKVPVDVDAVWLTQVFGDESPNGGEILALKPVLILDILQVGWLLLGRRHCHGVLVWFASLLVCGEGLSGEQSKK